MITVKFGRYAIRTKARKRIERATSGAQHFTGQWLVLDGKVPMRDRDLTAAEMETAQIRLGFGLLDGSDSSPLETRFHAHVPYRATSAEIETGWNKVAELVCAEEWKP